MNKLLLLHPGAEGGPSSLGHSNPDRSGGYADNDIGAVSTTGHGESILKVNLARLTLFHVEQGTWNKAVPPDCEGIGAVYKSTERVGKPFLVCCRRCFQVNAPSVRVRKEEHLEYWLPSASWGR